MTSTDNKCGYCEEGKSSLAVTWCPECAHALCDFCEKKHYELETSKIHTVISIENFMKLPQYIQQLELKCTNHNERHTCVCVNHELLLCNACIQDTHKSCNDVKPIPEVIKNSKHSVAKEAVKQCLNDVITNLHNIKRDRDDNIKMFNQQKKEILKEYTTFREEVIKKLNDTENKLIGDIDYHVEEQTKEIKTFLIKIDEQIADMKQMLRDIDLMTSFGSDFQTFFGIKEVEKYVHKEEFQLQSLFDNNQLDEICIKFNVNKQLQSDLTDITQACEIFLQTNPTKVRIFRKDKRQMQAPISSKESHLGLAQKFEIEEGSQNRSIRGCTFLPIGKFVFTDRNSQSLIIHAIDGSFQYIIEGQGRVFDVAAIDNECVAVTSGSEAVINLYNIESQKVVKTTKTNGPCYGITHKSGALFCCVEGKGIETMALSDDIISEFYKEALPWGMYITTVADKICFVNQENDIIKLLDSFSKVCWTFHYKHFLSDPRGVTSDDHGLIYLIGHTTKNVVSISMDNMECKQVLSMEDGLLNPTVIDFNGTRNSLMVVSWDGSVFVYNCN
ncbi:uncharacterized protein LOC127708028 [Mytilus californianus]|uniref:uncharacterized protein LOC127708028 n=1 Tax=Mytilus californianus TaxID=6549 RepID=UPI00224692C4|nr:uncharacterized protein LOC127708028 [Mytilus californianus]XP_052068782.1 uncharacterized protein LOC127708028 [Mytilus californianus]XP_052068784.1 uncharacterized protein LOC127708028 [Mytilus californianus]XP_052068785.1 uncharacterized protein LOC127708028 [Mytilus californianus]